jgi:hypothetical protein
VAALGAILLAAALYFAQPHADSPEHSSNSDVANGASAVLLFAEAIGHQTDQMTGAFNTPSPFSLLFVFTPTSPYTAQEADRLRGWVRDGGMLIYASEQGDPELDRALGVSRFDGSATGGLYTAAPALAGVTTVAGGGAVVPLNASTAQVPILRTSEGFVAGYVQKLGIGKVVVLADPLVLCNGYLEKADNGILLSDLISAPGGDATVTFDEYHHSLTVSDFAPQSWLTTPWGVALLWLVVAVFFGLVLRGRRFGPLVGRPAEVARSDAEWSVAVGQLLRRSSARAVTLGLLATATERAVASRTGLPLQPRERFWNALWVRAPEVAGELAEVETSLWAASTNEGQLLHAARRLHAIAHPATVKAASGRPLREVPPRRAWGPQQEAGKR